MGAWKDAETLSHSGDEDERDPMDRAANPWNIMIKHRQVQRRGRRSHVSVSFTDPAVSMDLLRAVLQPSINEEIQNVFDKYMKFFQKAAINVRDNVGEQVDPEQLIRETCRNCLEQAKVLFTEKGVPRPALDTASIKRVRQGDDDLSLRRSPVPKKRKGRPPGQVSSDRANLGFTPLKLKATEPIKREGPKWDPARLDERTTFVLGSRANKALGMGGTRGRIYIKHPELFKVGGPGTVYWIFTLSVCLLSLYMQHGCACLVSLVCLCILSHFHTLYFHYIPTSSSNSFFPLLYFWVCSMRQTLRINSG
ncbi:hypothetical protein XENTR_v10003871 [Xenopus tropicalis]|nr:hypothetical protein XENTR_v10003871 [Xenopus tropicalis]KAE8575542.1 hypothetical protein XENTR_v10003871 [Xenopus tropicalis]